MITINTKIMHNLFLEKHKYSEQNSKLRGSAFGLLTFFCLVSGFCSMAQGPVKEIPQEPWMVFQVKTLDQFISRFNRETIFPGHPKEDSLALLKMPQEDLLSSLFEEKASDSTATLFIRQAIDSTIRIPHDFSTLKVDIGYKATYQGKKVAGTLRMAMKQHENGAYSWAIATASMPFLELGWQQGAGYFFSSESHETGFLHVENALKAPEQLPNYFIKAPQLSNTELFFVLLRNQLLKVECLGDKTYYFAIPRLQKQLLLREFVRKTSNSGWLITKILPLPADQ